MKLKVTVLTQPGESDRVPPFGLALGEAKTLDLSPEELAEFGGTPEGLATAYPAVNPGPGAIRLQVETVGRGAHEVEAPVAPVAETPAAEPTNVSQPDEGGKKR